MAKSYRPVLRDQLMLLPIDLRDWLPPDHLVWFVLDTVEVLDTSELERVPRHRGGAGAPGYDPRTLLALLIYAYCQVLTTGSSQSGRTHASLARKSTEPSGSQPWIRTWSMPPSSRAGTASRKRLLALVQPTSKEEGCVRYEVYQSTDNDNDWFIFETWKSKEAFDFHG